VSGQRFQIDQRVRVYKPKMGKLPRGSAGSVVSAVTASVSDGASHVFLYRVIMDDTDHTTLVGEWELKPVDDQAVDGQRKWDWSEG
jgi:hypothetical protein